MRSVPAPEPCNAATWAVWVVAALVVPSASRASTVLSVPFSTLRSIVAFSQFPPSEALVVVMISICTLPPFVAGFETPRRLPSIFTVP